MALPSAWRDVAGEGTALFGLSLCAGAGGIDLGLTLAVPGYRAVCYVERESYAAAMLVARMEDAALDAAPIWDCVESFDGYAWCGIVDILSAGYPCQPFSVAGKKLGDKDPRHLWPHIARIVNECEPPVCFFENVGGHLRLGFEQVHDDLCNLGYRVKAGLFTAAEIGAPHLRERLFILAYRNGERCRGILGAAAGENDPQGWTQCVADTVPGGDSFAATGLPLFEAGFNQPPNGQALPDETDMAHPACAGAGQYQRRSRNMFDGGQQELGDAHGAGLERWGNDRINGENAQQPFPPSPADGDGWRRYLAQRPRLEPAICGGADGLAYRVDRLRLCGNGVVPLVAAYALRTLARAAIYDGTK